jgi:hypothetical protein
VGHTFEYAIAVAIEPDEGVVGFLGPRTTRPLQVAG